jgi:hypothetical protein
MKYKVTVVYTRFEVLEVEANCPSEAEGIALNGDPSESTEVEVRNEDVEINSVVEI